MNSTVEVREIIPAPAEAVFDVIHDYDRRLEWDTLLQDAYLEPAFSEAGIGAISVCRGRTILGGIALRTRYVSFQRGKVAAVEMLNRPPFFEKFAASIRHSAAGDGCSEVIYKVNFTARPRWLNPLIHPPMIAIFKWETKKRLKALREFFESNDISTPDIDRLPVSSC